MDISLVPYYKYNAAEITPNRSLKDILKDYSPRQAQNGMLSLPKLKLPKIETPAQRLIKEATLL